MKYRRLGSAGLRVSELSIGAWVTYGGQVDDSGTRACLLAAYEAGVNFFDNAEAYADGNAEISMGKVLKELPRESYVVSTKIFWGGKGANDTGLSRKHLTEGFHKALKRLQVDYVDLIFCHRPDPDTPIAETVWTMDNFIRQGKALYWGASEWDAQQLTEAYAVSQQHHLLPPQMEQPQYNMFHRERVEKEYAPLYQMMGLGTTIWSPLASGLLSGKYNDGVVPPDSRAALPGYEWLRKEVLRPDRLAVVKQLAPIAAELGCTIAQMALAWCLKNPHVSTVITGASRPEQVRENMKALDVVEKLTPDVMERIETLLGNRPK
ncbi:MAG: aldo/keto reductase [Chloroflexi bacterium]|nr:aldo/keto reductase [Chloroflexota bacterium]MCL5274141.1 aldo/keto reductase [Chloroflexota bacterium]